MFIIRQPRSNLLFLSTHGLMCAQKQKAVWVAGFYKHFTPDGVLKSGSRSEDVTFLWAPCRRFCGSLPFVILVHFRRHVFETDIEFVNLLELFDGLLWFDHLLEYKAMLLGLLL